MGPGFLPRCLSVLLALFGLAILIGAGRGGADAAEPEAYPGWRPIAAATGSVLVFAILIERTGIILAIVLSTAAAGMMTVGSWGRLLLLGAVLGLLVAAVFVLGLGLPIPLLPVW